MTRQDKDTKKHVVATSKRWIYYVHTYSDGSKALRYTDGHTIDGVWCGLSCLRQHLRHLKNVRYGKAWDTLIPNEWRIVDKVFFESMGIQ